MVISSEQNKRYIKDYELLSDEHKKECSQEKYVEMRYVIDHGFNSLNYYDNYPMIALIDQMSEHYPFYEAVLNEIEKKKPEPRTGLQLCMTNFYDELLNKCITLLDSGLNRKQTEYMISLKRINT